MKNRISLSDLEVGEKAVIETVKLEDPLLKRVYDLGFLPEVTVKCVQKAPAGSPIAYIVKSSIIALRKNDAEKILCKKYREENYE